MVALHWTEERRRAALELIAATPTARPHDPELYTAANVRRWTAAVISGGASVEVARTLLTALTHDSLPKPMMRWDSLGHNATTHADLGELSESCERIIRGGA